MKKLNERRVNPDLLKLNTSQKRVLMKTVEAGDPKRAAEDVAAAEDSRNLMAGVKVLAKYGLLVTYPEELGHDMEPEEIELTELGQQHADDYDVTNDPTLVTPEEQAASAPEGQPAETGTGGEEMGLGLEPEAGMGGEADLGLELSSFFHKIDNDAAIVRESRHDSVRKLFKKD